VKRSAIAVNVLLLAVLLLMPAVRANAADAKPAAAAKPAASGQKVTDAKTPAAVDSLGLLERAVAKDSTKFDNLYKLGVMYLDHDKTEEAVKVLTKAVVIRPKDVKALVNLGAAFDARGAAPVAQGYYREAIKNAPGDSVAMCRLASSLYASSNVAEAVSLLREVIRTRPNSYCAYFTLGVAFADAGIYRDAIRMWRKVIALAPQSPEATSATESIEVLERYVKTTN
jgi:Flp pilus assembly protein TadD